MVSGIVRNGNENNRLKKNVIDNEMMMYRIQLLFAFGLRN